MADLIQRDPPEIVEDLLQSEWDSSAITAEFDADARIHKGWYDENVPVPQISVTPASETTSAAGIDATGAGTIDDVDGILDVNVWVPYHRNSSDERSQFSSPGLARKHRFELKMQVWNIIKDNEQGTMYNGERELADLAVGNPEEDAETDDTPLKYRALVPVGYLWHVEP